MLTEQASLGVEVPCRQVLNLRGQIKNLMRKHDMMRDDLCYLSASECQLGLDTRRGEVEVKAAPITYPALHPAILGLVSDVHVDRTMQIPSQEETRPILHSVTRPSRLIRDTTCRLNTTRSSSSANQHLSVEKEPLSMPTKTAAHYEEWNHELRMGLHRSIGFYRAKLMRYEDPLNEHDRQGMKDLLNLLEEYMSITWPGNDAV